MNYTIDTVNKTLSFNNDVSILEMLQTIELLKNANIISNDWVFKGQMVSTIKSCISHEYYNDCTKSYNTTNCTCKFPITLV